jgi:RHS repeat-associated protein
LSQGSYDIANHFIQAGAALYGYAPNGKRVWKAPDGIAADEEFYFWSPQGQRMGTYKSTSPGTQYFTTASTNIYFGGRLIEAQGTTVLTNRLGSNVTGGRRYFPYGQEYTATANNLEKFTGYFRDAETGLDYADQRYHEPGFGRFTTPDPAGRGLNWYAYVGGDPINNSDPSGLDSVGLDSPCTATFCITVTNSTFPDLTSSPETGPDPFPNSWSDSCITVGLCPTMPTPSAAPIVSANPAGPCDTGSLYDPAITALVCDGPSTGPSFSGVGGFLKSLTLKPPLLAVDAPICINPWGCGPSAPTLTPNFAIGINLGSGMYKGGEGTLVLVPSTSEVLLGGGITTSFPPGPAGGFSLLVSPGPIAPIIQGPSLTVTANFLIGFTAVISGSGVAVGSNFGLPTFSWTVGGTNCYANCHP